MMFKTPVPKELSDEQIARLAMIAELDAISFYEGLAEMAKDETLKETLLDVANEEKVHFGEFLSAVVEKDWKFIDEGLREVCERAEKLGIRHPACKITERY